MNKFATFLCVVLALTLGIVLTPTLSLAADFSYTGTPAFTVTYPDGSKTKKIIYPDQVWAVETLQGLIDITAFVSPIPEGIELKDVAEKTYKLRLENVGRTKAKMICNEEITLSDGTKAYYSAMEWKLPNRPLHLVTVLVSVYKDGKWVLVVGHPTKERHPESEIPYRGNNIDTAIKTVKSLKFK